MAFPEKQLEAIKLRVEERLSLAAISKKIEVAKSTCSLWLREYPLAIAEVRSRQKPPIPLAKVESRRVHSQRNTKELHFTRFNGSTAMLKMQLRAVAKGCTVSIPTTEVRYDAVLDDHGHLSRVQVKYCNAKPGRSDGAYQVGLQRRGNKYTACEIDAVVVYIPESDKIYWIPIEKCADLCGFVIRLHPARNRQSNGINFASDYEW